MSQKQSWQALFPKFPESQIAIALEITLAAGKDLRKESLLEHENDISKRLLLRIKQTAQFRSADLNIDSQFNVHDPQNTDPELRGIPDLTFKLLNAPKPVPYFAIDAKRLRFMQPSGKFETGNSEYVSGYQDAGAMLGYVYDGQIDAAKRRITELIGKHARLLKCKEPHTLVASKLPTAESGVDETIHALDGRDFRIFHVFLAV